MNLKTTYLGLRLRTPLVASASPLSDTVDDIRKLEDAGAAAVVLHSIFQEQITADRHELHHHLIQGTESFAESLTYFPEPPEVKVGPESYLQLIQGAKESVDIPIMASLKGRDARRVDDLRRSDAAGRRRCSGIKHLLDPDRL